MPTATDNICIPMHLDAFAISPGCCDGASSLAPYTQPNYTSLRLDSHLVQHDVLDHVDFHLASPAWNNPRLADIGTSPGDPAGKNLKMNRIGVHLSWSLPRFYRSAQASGRSPTEGAKGEDPNPNPAFRPIPNRWLVLRHLHNFKDESKLPEWQAWVVESDVIRKITSPTMGDSTDLESDVAPFISYKDDPKKPPDNDENLLKAQTEIFLGQKINLSDPWREVPESVRSHMPKLTIMSSSNPLFPDNALHNTNVLSMLDNFEYDDHNQPTGLGHLRKANCDYFVIGWHKNGADDPFSDPNTPILGSQLSKLLLQLDDSLDQDLKDKLSISQGPTRCLVHGAIYGVQYDFSYDPKKSQTRSLANEAASKFTEKTPIDNIPMEPLSIGTTPLDGILTFLEAHKTDADHFFGSGAGTIADSLLDMAQLLYATGDNYDSRVQAQDLIAQQNFSKVDGGLTWVFAKTTTPGQPTQLPTDYDKQLLLKLNNTQAKLDTAQRELLSLRWELFAEWWKYISTYIPLKEKEEINKVSKKAIYDLASGIDKMDSLVKSLQADLLDHQNDATCRTTASDPFHTRSDPTLCIAGLDSGWPPDWQDTLTIRVSSQLKSDTDEVSKEIFGSMDASNPVPSENGLAKAALGILGECLKNTTTGNGVDGKPNVTGFLQWGNRNPFVPLSIEWEAMYYHVAPFKDKWDVRLRPSPVGHAHPTLRYVPTELLSQKSANHTDFRSVSGRVLVMPQPVFSLEAIVMQVLDSTSDDTGLSDQQKDDLRSKIRQIQFISAPLSGLTNHLLTRFEGAHVKPNVHVQGDRSVIPLQAAVRTAPDADIGLDKATLAKIGGESALTPYGDAFPFGTDQYPNAPFKPVTHGQLVLTKLNIIDKFGQAVCLPKVLRRPRVPPLIPATTIYPSLSDWLAPDALENADQEVKAKFMNTIFPTDMPVQEGHWPLCQYVELTPAINQDARINASFLFRKTVGQQQYSDWQEATDYDPMVWGWVIINYADNGLQFFLGDGRFYREIRKGGVEGTNLSPKWLPFDPPTQPEVPGDAGEAQLAQLIEALRDVKYFQHFNNAINGAIQNMPFPPSDYSGYANAIVGKPLALVNVGWSLELAAPAIKSQNTLGKPATDLYATLSKYSFPLKIGDIERNYDGVCGYWTPKANDKPSSTAIDFSLMNTYFVTTWSNLPAGTILHLPPPHGGYTVRTGDTVNSISSTLSIPIDKIKALNQSIPDSTAKDSFRPIAPGNFIPLNPYHTSSEDVTDMLADRVSHYTVTSILVDPYTSIHGYTPILPTKALTIPSFVIQTAFEKMHAFFHLGPMLLTSDVPPAKDAAKDQIVSLPVSGRKGTWTWLQPYATADANDVNPIYAEMQVQEDLGDKKYEKPPYTFIEGFLQLMGSLEQKNQAKAAAGAGG